jgi:hypothetical protein
MTPPADTAEELELLIRSGHGLIVLDTVEEGRAESLLRRVAAQQSLHCYSWRRSNGLRHLASGQDAEPVLDATAEPAHALSAVASEGSGIYHFPAFASYLADGLVIAHLKDAVDRFRGRRGAVVFSGNDVVLPESLQAHVAVLRLPAPTDADFRRLVERLVRDLSSRMPVEVDLTEEDATRLIANLRGMTLLQAERLLTKMVMQDGKLRGDDVRHVIAAKRGLVEREGLLEYYPADDGLGGVAGLGGLKAWLAKRRAVLADPRRAATYGLTFPKGVLLLGVPGCGKSLCARAVANEWRLPLLKLDPSNLYNKYVGESEKNFKRAMRAAERMAPAVLWIDELEKAFASGGSDEDGGVSTRVLGTFLSWLQDRDGDVFVVATANDVSKLPPEFIRKGRFDEVFFVDLPAPAERRAIFEIHLARRQQKPACFDLDALADATDGFSGAEIEQLVVSALCTAFAEGVPLSAAHLHAEARTTHPLARTMGERLATLREWARDRTVTAA